MPNIENNENLSICAACKGGCCRHYGGILHPDDVKGGVTFENIKKMIDTGMYGIDWYEGYGDEETNNADVYFMHMAHVNEPKVYPTFGGTCVNLTPDGCKLPFEERAYGCRALVPEESHKCGKGCYSKYDAKRDWLPYQSIMEEVVKLYREG